VSIDKNSMAGKGDVDWLEKFQKTAFPERKNNNFPPTAFLANRGNHHYGT